MPAVSRIRATVPERVSTVTRSSTAVRRVALPLTAALVGGTFAAFSATAPAQAAGSQSVDQSFDYKCDVSAGGLSLGNHVVGVRTQATIPTSAYRGERIAPTPVTLTLTMPELLRSSTVTLLQGTDASGQSNDAAIVLASAGKSLTVNIPSLAAPKTAIPQVEAPWLIPASGTVPAIIAPKTIDRSITLSMPSKFTITATVYKADDSSVDADLTCVTAGGSLMLGKALGVQNFKPTAKKKITVTAKKNKAKKVKLAVFKAKDRDGDRLKFKAGKVKKKAGKVKFKGKNMIFKPRKNFKGKTSFVVSINDGRGGVARTKVVVKVKK